MKTTSIIRFILTLALIFGVYTETGHWTALSLFLVFFYIEISTWLKQQVASQSPKV